ncbi:MAG TPA: HNH endonuclease [Clostridiaceae bacterium]
MALLKTILIKNGYENCPYEIYECNSCGKEIEEAWPRYSTGENIDYCFECAFKESLIDGKQYLRHCGIDLDDFHAAVSPDTNEIIVWKGRETPFWNRADSDYRKNTRYKHWRKAVFERDEYICQKCGQVGGALNAHHVKTFAKHKKLRYVIDNGITLCEACHKSEHKSRCLNGTT